MEIKFNCANPACKQPVTVDGAEAGRWHKCPACGKVAQVPGTRARSLLDEPVVIQVQAVRAEAAGVAAEPEGGEDAGAGRSTWFWRAWTLVQAWGLGAALLGLAMGAFGLARRAALPRNVDAMMSEIYFHGEILTAPAINHAGTLLVYVRTVENGVGVFLVNLETLERKQIALARPHHNSRSGSVKLSGWSADDRSLAFSVLQKQTRSISICDGATGTPRASYAEPRAVEAGRWLGSSSLVLLDDEHLLFLLNLEANGRLGSFGRAGFVKVRKLGKSDPWVIPDSDHSVAFVEQGNVWGLDLAENRLAQVTHLTNATLSELDYSSDNYCYLFSATLGGSNAPVLCQNKRWAMPGTTALSCVTPTNFASKGRWLQNGAGVAYVGTAGNRFFVGLQATNGAAGTNLFAAAALNRRRGYLNRREFPEGRDVVRTYALSPKRDKIYTVASVGYHPLAVWEYDLGARTLRNVVPEKEKLTAAHFIEPVQAWLTNQNGKVIAYYSLPPPGPAKGGKYPVVMDQFSDLGYQANSQFLANAGIWYVTVNPYGMGFPQGPTAPEDTLAVYNELLKQPLVDTNRIYLLGESAGTAAVATLLSEYPQLWRGAAFAAPVAFPAMGPEFQSRRHSLLFSLGDDDSAQNQARAEAFARAACAQLVNTKILYYGGGHVLFDTAMIKQKYRQIAEFILTDY